jgi:hypothetical protein
MSSTLTHAGPLVSSPETNPRFPLCPDKRKRPSEGPFPQGAHLLCKDKGEIPSSPLCPREGQRVHHSPSSAPFLPLYHPRGKGRGCRPQVCSILLH